MCADVHLAQQEARTTYTNAYKHIHTHIQREIHDSLVSHPSTPRNASASYTPIHNDSHTDIQPDSTHDPFASHPSTPRNAHSASHTQTHNDTHTSTQPDSIHNSFGSHLSTPRHNLTSLPPRGLYSSLTPRELRSKGGAAAHLESESVSTSGGGGSLYHPTARYTMTPCNTLQQTATDCNRLQHPRDGRDHPMERGKPQRTTTHCNALQRNLFSPAAVPCSTESCARTTPHDRRRESHVYTGVCKVSGIVCEFHSLQVILFVYFHTLHICAHRRGWR